MVWQQRLNAQSVDEAVHDARLEGFHWQSSVFTELSVQGGHYLDGRIESCDFFGGQLIDLVFVNCDFSSVRFERVDFERCRFVNCRFKNLLIVQEQKSRGLDWVIENTRAQAFKISHPDFYMAFKSAQLGWFHILSEASASRCSIKGHSLDEFYLEAKKPFVLEAQDLDQFLGECKGAFKRLRVVAQRLRLGLMGAVDNLNLSAARFESLVLVDLKARLVDISGRHANELIYLQNFDVFELRLKHLQCQSLQFAQGKMARLLMTNLSLTEWQMSEIVCGQLELLALNCLGDIKWSQLLVHNWHNYGVRLTAQKTISASLINSCKFYRLDGRLIAQFERLTHAELAALSDW